jgi:peptidoglycan/xylan/chitin deacetylase (PgdA/CDA1 family)
MKKAIVLAAGVAVTLICGCTTTGSETKFKTKTTNIPVPDKLIAFSIDDGPSPGTEELLTVLKEKNVKATMFLIGQNIENYNDAAKKIVEAGHETGNHSYGWAGLGNAGNAGEDQIRESLGKTSALIKELTGNDPAYFRAPNLDYSDTLSAISADLGLALIGSNVIGVDWDANITTEGITDNILNSAHDGGIILLHELHEGDIKKTIRVLPVIIDKLRQLGYKIVTVGELAERKGVTVEAGNAYNEF